MTALIRTPRLTLEQQVVLVDVNFYNTAERLKLLDYPTGRTIEEMTKQPIAIPTAEVLAYYLFHKKRTGSPLYGSFRSIAPEAGEALVELRGCVEFSGHSIRRAEGVEAQVPHVTEYLGEAIGLAVVSRIHGLNDADWSPIPAALDRKTFDYEIASDGGLFVEVENKGSSAKDNRRQSPEVSKQKGRIDAKKRSLGRGTSVPIREDEPAPAPRLCYGTIVVVDGRKDGNVRCWLTDPPTVNTLQDPRRFRALARLRFLRDWISLVSVRSQLAAALATRVADLEALANIDELSGLPLLKGSGEPFETWPEGTGTHSFFNNKSRIVGTDAGGVLTRPSSSHLFFVGISADLLSLAAEGAFERIVGFRVPATSENRTVRCHLSENVFKAWNLSEVVEGTKEPGGRGIEFDLKGLIHSTQSGTVFGLLPLPVR